MVIKDWKIRLGLFHLIAESFYEFRKNDRFIEVWKPPFAKDWGVLIGRRLMLEGRVKKYFKTKSAALKFAKSWMRKH